MKSLGNMVEYECKKDGGGDGETMVDLTSNEPSSTASSEFAFAAVAGRRASVLNKPIANKHQTNYMQTLMHLLNGFIGSGILSMPSTFRDGGLLLSSIFNPLIGLLSCFCIHRLLAINQLMMAKTGKPPMDYHEVAEYTFVYGPPRFAAWSLVARRVVLSALIATQIGGCCVYFLFIATNIERFLDNLVGTNYGPTQTQCLLMVLPIAIGVNWIRSIKHLSILSTASNILQVISIGIVFYFLFSKPMEKIDKLPLVGKKLPEFFVSTLFIYEGISVSCSLYRSIDTPSKFSRPTGVLNVGLVIITIFYASLGFIGYARFGDDVPAAITYELPNEAIYNVVQIFYALAVLCTYPIILYVPISILWPIIKQRFFIRVDQEDDDDIKKNKTKQTNKDVEQDAEKTRKLMWRKKIIIHATNCSFRACLVLLTYFLAVVIPKLDLIISLVGAVTSSSIAIMIPVILHTIAFWDEVESNWARARLLLVNGVIFGIGLTGFVLGTYFSLSEIIAEYLDGEIEIENIPPVINGTLFSLFPKLF